MPVNTANGIAIFIGRQFLSRQADSLEDADMMPDPAGLANDGTGSVVDGEVVADDGTRMDVNACFGVGHLGNHPRNEGNPQDIQLMGNAIVADGPESWVAKDHFAEVLGGWISVEGGLRIGSQQPTYLRQGGNEGLRKLLSLQQARLFRRLTVGRVCKAEPGMDLVRQSVMQLGDQDTFIADFTIASPLTQRERYTTGSDFVYLQFWLQWEAKRTDYVPVLRLARGQPGWQLVFVPSGSFSWTDWELSVVQLLEEEFYKGRTPGLGAADAADGSDAAVEARS